MTVDVGQRPVEREEADPGRETLSSRSTTTAFNRLERLAPTRRPSKWDRPAPSHDWRWTVATIGKMLIATGILMAGFVGYQLWGTGIEYAQAQDALDAELETLLSSNQSSTPVASAPPAPTAQSVVPASAAAPATTPTSRTTTPLPAVQPGNALARIELPTIGVDAAVIEGVGPDDLKRGPGHYPSTPRPGQLGNAAIAGHRTTYGAPFAELDEVKIGDRIIVTTAEGRYVYRMTAMEIVSPSAGHVLATTDPSVARLTLTTCHPEYSAQLRLIVFADLDIASSAVPAPYQPPTQVAAAPPNLAAEGPTGRPDDKVTPLNAADPPVRQEGVTVDSADAFAQGWFSDDAAFGQVALWGSLLTAIGLGAYLLSRAVRHNWAGAAAGTVPFVVAAYFFFQNVNRLLPAAV